MKDLVDELWKGSLVQESHRLMLWAATVIEKDRERFIKKVEQIEGLEAENANHKMTIYEKDVIIATLEAENERLRLRVEPRYLNNPKFESSLILFFDWAMIWHRQAGGYLASDTSLLLGRVETFIDEMVDRNPKLECFRPNIKRLRSVPRAEELLKGEPVICLTCGQVVRLEGDE